MPKFISLLRGINVSGQKKIRMADLKTLYENLGFTNVQTYLQSGNVVFTAKGKEAGHVKKIQTAIHEKYGFEVPVLVLTANRFTKIADSNPFLKKKKFEKSSFYLTLLFEKPTVDFDSITLPKSGEEEALYHNGHVFFYGPNGYGRTKLNNNYFERALKVSATTRNWKTVQALKTMFESSD